MIDDSDDTPQLSAHAFLALQEFYNEQQQKELNQINETPTFDEDWQLSQFWYDENTVQSLVNIALDSVGKRGKIALVSCPSLYKPLRENLDITAIVHLYEFDRRFSHFGEDFMFYDYKDPLNIPKNYAEFYDLVIADPPFLSEECLTKTALSLKFLAKQKIILCTGQIMADLVHALLTLKETRIKPKHKNNLANEFSCFSNFNI